MPTHIALLRGINVGGRNRVAMADLRKVVLGLGHTEVVTYIQSGNVVFTSEEADTARIAAALERAIAKHLGVRPTVVVLTRAELAQVVADNPFPDEPNPRWVHAIFRNGPLGPDELAAVAAAQQRARDEGSDDEAAGVLAAFADITVEEFEAQADIFPRTTQHPTLGRGYLACSYRPLVELLGYLEANGFANYIASGWGAGLHAADQPGGLWRAPPAGDRQQHLTGV
jgi:uncharacterized protein (DUF1697 family)